MTEPSAAEPPSPEPSGSDRGGLDPSGSEPSGPDRAGPHRTGPHRRWLDLALSWGSLLYGIYCAAYDAAHTRDELQIAFGIEAMVIALLDFLWARAPRSLGLGLIVAGLSAPVIGLGSAPLFWHDVRMFAGDAFFTSLIVGGVVAAPLVWLGRRTLLHARVTQPATDPRWLTPLRWALRLGLWLIVLAFRLGDFRSGTVLVYIGAALALTSLGIGLPRRIVLGPGSLARLLLLLGASALVITLVAGAAVGSHMSPDEALLGIVPALLLIGLGTLLARRTR